MSSEEKEECGATGEPTVRAELEVAKPSKQQKSGRSRRSTKRSDDEAEDKSKELHGSPSSDKKGKRKSERSSRSPKPRNSRKRRSSAHDKDGRDSSRKSGSSNRKFSNIRRLDSTVSQDAPGLSASSGEMSLSSSKNGDRSASLSPRRDQDAKRKSRRSTPRPSTPGVESITESSTREARKSARASSRVSKSSSLSPRRSSDDGDDQVAKRRSRRSTRASTPGVEVVIDQNTREARKSARRSTTSARRSGASINRRGTSSGDNSGDLSSEPLAISREIDDNLETIRQQEEERNRNGVAKTKKKEREKNRRRRLCWIMLCCLLLLSIGGGVATFLFFRTKDINNASSTGDEQNEVPPTDAPTNDYFFDPPSRQDCTNLRLKRPIGDREKTVEESFDLHFDVILSAEKETDVWNFDFLTAIEEYLLPSLLGCDDAVDRRSMMIQAPIRRELATLRYIIGDAVVTGRVALDKSCLPENESDLCFRSIVTLQLYLKGDVGVDDLVKLIVGVIVNEKFDGVPVNDNRLLQESLVDVDIPLVDRWVLPDTFANVFYVLIEAIGSGSPPNPAPTLPSPVPSESPSSNPSSSGGGGGEDGVSAPATNSPTVSPTPRPTKRPTRAPAPGVTNDPTIAPSQKPSGIPSEAPSQNPTPQPTVAPTPGLSSPPTARPVLSPTLPPKQPTLAPQAKQPTPLTKQPVLPTKTPMSRPPTPLGPPPVTDSPTRSPTSGPTSAPTSRPTSSPTSGPTSRPTSVPVADPTPYPTSGPTSNPTSGPTSAPTKQPTHYPTSGPTSAPTIDDSAAPSARPIRILDFDNLTGGSGECLVEVNEITDGYEGFQWDYFGVVDLRCDTGGSGHSSPNGAGPMSTEDNAFGEFMSFELTVGSTFDLISVEAYNGDSSCPFTLYGYGPGEISPSADLDVTPSSDEWFTIDLSSFTGIAKFEYVNNACTGPLRIVFDDFKMYMNND